MKSLTSVLTLRNTAFLYLLFPVVLFFGYWIRIPYNLIILALLVVSGARYIRENSHTEFHEKRSRREWAFIFGAAILSILLAVASGAGGFVIQRGDWTKHNVVINDLMNFNWPVYYGPSTYVKDTTLVYYLAYYLPPALIGKLGGWRAAELASFVYTFMGLWIFVLLVKQSVRVGLRELGVLFLFSGMDVFGWLLLNGLPIRFSYLETYAQGLQFPSLISQLIWVPQHTISAWLLFVVMYQEYQNGSLWRYSPLYISIALLWSPFVALGLVLLFVPFMIRDLIKSKDPNIVYVTTGILLSAIILVYYKSQIPILNDHIILYWEFYKTFPETLWRMIIFLLVDLLIFLPLLLFKHKQENVKDKRLGVWAVILLILVAQFRYGAANDWIMRVSMPALIGIALIIAKNARTYLASPALIRYYFIAVVLIGAVTPISQALLLNQVSNPATNEQPDRNMLYAHQKYGVIHQQYMGSASRLFGKVFGNYKVKQN